MEEENEPEEDSKQEAIHASDWSGQEDNPRILLLNRSTGLDCNDVEDDSEEDNQNLQDGHSDQEGRDDSGGEDEDEEEEEANLKWVLSSKEEHQMEGQLDPEHWSGRMLETISMRALPVIFPD